MDSRWWLLGFGLLFGVLTLGFIYRGNVMQALIAGLFTVFSLGGFWWNTTHDDSIDTMSSRSG